MNDDICIDVLGEARDDHHSPGTVTPTLLLFSIASLAAICCIIFAL